MTSQRPVSYLLLLSLFWMPFFGCSQKMTRDALTDRMSMQKSHMTTMMEELIQWRNTMNVQGRALTDIEHDFVRDVNDLETDFIGWQVLEEPTGKKELERRLEALTALTERAERLLERDIPGREGSE